MKSCPHLKSLELNSSGPEVDDVEDLSNSLTSVFGIRLATLSALTLSHLDEKYVLFVFPLLTEGASNLRTLRLGGFDEEVDDADCTCSQRLRVAFAHRLPGVDARS
ncbi:hypothetical protein PM082_018883 [Marasmius tenuissimus]|nr:hypothetical protein PM082_018883 [Marasmius tenuissimus]